MVCKSAKATFTRSISKIKDFWQNIKETKKVRHTKFFKQGLSSFFLRAITLQICVHFLKTFERVRVATRKNQAQSTLQLSEANFFAYLSPVNT